MHRGEAADNRVVAHLYMSGERAVVGKNNGVSHRAIVPDVRVGEKISTAPDARFAGRRRASVDRDEFAKRVLVANLEISRLAAIFQILGLLADRAIGVELVASPGRERPAQRDVMLQPAVFA